MRTVHPRVATSFPAGGVWVGEGPRAIGLVLFLAHGFVFAKLARRRTQGSRAAEAVIRTIRRLCFRVPCEAWSLQG